MNRTPVWIWENGNRNPDEYARFYDAFSYDGISPAALQISCDGNYECFLNGTCIAFGQYGDFPDRKVFDTVSLTKHLRTGENRLCILVWYPGVGSMTYCAGAPGVFWRLTAGNGLLSCSDASVLCCRATDYVCGRCRRITSQLGLSYAYDFRGRIPDSECKPPESAHPACPFPERSAPPCPRPNEKLRLRPFLPAGCIDPVYRVYDLGEETVGYLSVTFRAPAGTVLTIGWGETLTKPEDSASGKQNEKRSGDRVRSRIGDRSFSVELTADGTENLFVNRMRRLGCRYLQVFCSADTEIRSIGLFPAYYPVKLLPYRASTPLRQRIYDVSVRTLRLCMFEHYEDCPWREQALYTLDSRNQMLFGYAAFGEYTFARSSLWLIGNDDRREDGLLHICAPSREDLVIPFFSLIYPIEMCEYADASGDTSLIRCFYGRMRKILSAFLSRTEKDGTVPIFFGDERYWNFYEWNRTLEGTLSRQEEKKTDTALNAALILALEAMASMAERIGEKADAGNDRIMAQNLRKALQKKLWCPAEELFYTSDKAEEPRFSQLANAFALLADAVPENSRKRVANRLADDPVLIPVTLSMQPFRYDALLAVDAEKYRERILSEIDRDYGLMLNAGATSFWETIKGSADFGGAGSCCHGWSAAPVRYLRLLEPEGTVTCGKEPHSEE